MIWISHRGLKTHAVENTKESFQSAISGGFLCFETDVRVTQDDHLVLCHDLSFARFGGVTQDLAEMSRSEIEKIILHNGSKPYFFDEFVENLAGYSWVLDIKPEHGTKALKALGKWATNHNAHDWLSANAKFLVWSRRDEVHLKSIFPTARFYAREMECWYAGLTTILGLSFLGKIVPGKTYAIPPVLGGVKILTHELVKKFHKRGAQVVAFLPQSISQVQMAIEAEVDEILTDGMIIQS